MARIHEMSLLKFRLSLRKICLKINSFIDEDNILVIGESIGNSYLPRSSKHLLLLPGNHSLSTPIIQHYRSIFLHSVAQIL